MSDPITWDPRVQPDSTGSLNFLADPTPSDTSIDREVSGSDSQAAALAAEVARAKAAEIAKLPLAGGTMTGPIAGLAASGTFTPAALSSAPTYVEGGVYYDTTQHALYVGGATAWEKVTSA
jgi:hypothetical protein